jgi:opacity protein-like surface antigen
MKNIRKMKGKRLAAFIAGMVLICGNVSAADSLAGVQNSFSAFSEALAKSLPFNASVGLNWSDAYIGQLISLPPHFGVGVSGGFTTMDFDAINGLVKIFGLPSLPLSFMPLPAYTVEGRIGGFILPFDIGVKIGTLPDVSFGNFKFKYLLAGADFRYALLKGEAILPAVSIGFGVNYLSGGISAQVGSGMEFEVPDTGGKKLSLSAPTASFSWETVSFELKAQISKRLFIITPYFGAGVSYALSKAGYEIESKLTYTGSDINEIKQHVSGLDSINANGFKSMSEINGFGVRAFGGLSLNLAIIKLDLTGMFNFIDQNWGGTLGLRVQL